MRTEAHRASACIIAEQRPAVREGLSTNSDTYTTHNIQHAHTCIHTHTHTHIHTNTY